MNYKEVFAFAAYFPMRGVPGAAQSLIGKHVVAIGLIALAKICPGCMDGGEEVHASYQLVEKVWDNDPSRNSPART
eukprot:1156616-Pelagomonas_calceolata.AAC.4